MGDTTFTRPASPAKETGQAFGPGALATIAKGDYLRGQVPAAWWISFSRLLETGPVHQGLPKRGTTFAFNH